MNQAFRLFLKKPQTYVAVIVALMAQLIFCLVWMTAYHGVLDRVDHLKIAIVNDNGEFGKAIETQLQKSLPFEIIDASKESALDKLNERDVQLVLNIPSGFDKSLSNPGDPAQLPYILNDANPQLTKSVMQSVIDKVTNQLNHQAALQGTQVALQQMQLPADQASKTANSLLNKVTSEVQTLNPVKGMQNQMVPMMLILASFVGAMLMAMNIQQVSDSIGNAASKWAKFNTRAIINIAAAFLISLAGSSLITVLNGQMESGFGQFWLFHFLTIVAFMFFAQMFLIVFGMAGMFLNMLVLSLQLVTSGTIVPRQMLSSFYDSLGNFLPATYSVDGIMNLQFGGGHMGKDIGLLFLTIVISVGVSAAVTLVRKQGKTFTESEVSTVNAA